MASTVSILIAARAATAAAFARARADVARLNASIAATTRSWGRHRMAVSSVAGAYRDANGLWRQADGRLLTQRHTVRQVTVSLGLLTDVMHGLTDAGIRNAPIMAAVAGKIAAITLAALPLVGAIGNLVPLIMLTVPAAAGAGLAMLGMKVAMNGIQEALDAGLSGDVEAFEKALKKLPKSAADTVRVLVRLRDQWKPLKQEFQSRVFEGAAGELESLSRVIRPIADRQFPRLANSIAQVRNQLANGLANYAADGRLEKVWSLLNYALDSLLKSAPPVARAIGDILQVAAPALSTITDSIKGAAEAFSDWIRRSKDSGDLQKWLDKAMETFGKLKDIAVNVGEIIGGVFRASGNEGDSMLDQMISATQSISDWVNGDGQGVISFFSSVFALLGQVAPLFSLWSDYFSGISYAAKAAWELITDVFRTAIGLWLGYLNVLVQGAAKAFGWIPGIGPKLKAAAAEFEQFKNQVNNSLDNIQDETVNIVYRAIRVGDHTYSGAQAGGSYSSGIGGVASGGPGGSVRQVNEHGHEFVDFTRGMVYNSNQTKRLRAAAAAAGGGGRGDVHLHLDPAAGSNMGAAVASLLGAALSSGQLRLRADGAGNVSLAGR